jgi:ketosteroid isomerase-like protein
MSESNLDLVRQAMRAFSRRDLPALEAICHSDIELDWSRRLLDPQVIHGLDGLRRFFEDIDGIFEEVIFEEEEITDFGQEVLFVSTGRFRGRMSGAQVKARGANIWTIRDGKLARFCFYQAKEDALEDLAKARQAAIDSGRKA